MEHDLEPIIYEPETQFEVERLTHLCGRTMHPKDEYRWLTCQLGAFTFDENKREIFVLKAHGTCWRDAFVQWKGLEERRAAGVFA